MVKALGTMLLKVMGLIWLVSSAIGILNTIGFAFSSPEMAGAGDQRYTLMTAGANAIVTLILGAVLVIYADRIISALGVADGVDEGAERSFVPSELQAVAFGAVGAYLGIEALRSIGTLVYAIARRPAWDETGTMAYMFQNHQSELAGAAVQLIASVLLLLNRSALAEIWWRSHRHDSPSDPESSDR